jgi:hypothetical protein
MHHLIRALLLTIIFTFCNNLSSFGQFSYKAKRANLTINFDKESGWILTNQAGTKTYFEFSDENAYIQIVDNTLRIYKMSAGLWNSHPDSKFMDKIHIKNTSTSILANASAFDTFSSFWISSAGGHIRIFRYAESITNPDEKSESKVLNNKYVGNSIFLNQNKSAKISSKNTLFMISPSGDVFEIDPAIKTWRLILPNRTLTHWTSDPPTDKLLFNIFKKSEFKKVISIGTKNDKYYFQIIDHNNKMGLAYLTKDYFQVVMEIPPLFDFITPSFKTDYHLILNENKLGVLYFAYAQNEDEIKEFKSFYTTAKTTLFSHGSDLNKGPLLGDENTFSITKNAIKKTSNDFLCDLSFGIEIINNDLILYTEFDETKEINQSGLFRISQSQWYIKPEKNMLIGYPSTTLEVNHTSTNDLLYNCYSSNGYLKMENVSNKNISQFTALTAFILETQIDTLIAIPEFDTFTFKFKSLEKWGIIYIKDENFKLITPAKYDWVQHYGNHKSLLIINENKFGWYGINYSSSESLPILIEPINTSLSLSQKNLLIVDNILSPNLTTHRVEFSNNHFIFNTITKGDSKPYYSAWIQKTFNGEQINATSKIESAEGYFNLINIQNNTESMSLLNHKLKPIVQTKYDSISIIENQMLLFDNSQSQSFTLNSGEQINRAEVIGGFYVGKPVKTLSKYENVYYYENHFLAKKDNSWLVLEKDGKPAHKLPFKSILEAFAFTRSLSK